MSLIKLYNLLYTERLIIHIFQKCQTAHLIGRIERVHLHDQIFGTRILQRDRRISLLTRIL